MNMDELNKRLRDAAIEASTEYLKDMLVAADELLALTSKHEYLNGCTDYGLGVAIEEYMNGNY